MTCTRKTLFIDNIDAHRDKARALSPGWFHIEVLEEHVWAWHGRATFNIDSYSHVNKGSVSG